MMGESNPLALRGIVSRDSREVLTPCVQGTLSNRAPFGGPPLWAQSIGQEEGRLCLPDFLAADLLVVLALGLLMGIAPPSV